MKRQMTTIDGNEAAAYSAYYINDISIIYPITPSSPIAEHIDKWSANCKQNIWGTVPSITEMQSEAGAAGALHGSIQRGALTTTFTASQGLLLMIPNMFKIAGELTPTLFHVAARTVATHALSIFCDHSDVMATRSTGFAILSSSTVQEILDFGIIAQAATLESRIPFLHFFDGFRKSHEISKVELPSIEDMRTMIDNNLVVSHRNRALSPDNPFIRGTAQNPDTFFQERETVNSFYISCPDIVQKAMDKFSDLVGRKYSLFQYFGSPEADRVIVLMGSGAEAAQETAEYLISKHNEKVGIIKVNLYRPFSVKHFINSLPKTIKTIAVLDRTKEPGAVGEPLYVDVLSSIGESRSYFNDNSFPRVIGGRYGLSSKEFTPGMIKAVFDEMNKDMPKNHFTIGINDDITYTSLEFDKNFSIEPIDRTRAIFYGLGSDGTVGASKSSIKIIGKETNNYVQGYFVFDSRKAGSLTISHLRFGKDPIHSPYLITTANFVACHQFSFLNRFDILKEAEPGSTFLLNSQYSHEDVWNHLPITTQKHIIDKKLKFYTINAYKIAKEAGLGVRINTIMQTCFFLLTDVIENEKALSLIKDSIKENYSKKGESVVNINFSVVDMTKDNLYEVKVPKDVTSDFDISSPVPKEAPEFVQKVTSKMLCMEGDELPSSAFPCNGTFPSGTTKWEKRNIGTDIPVWDPDTCIQCGKCSLVCPHASIRAKVYDKTKLSNFPETFKSTNAKRDIFNGMHFTIQVSPRDCTSCGLCVEMCPAKNMKNKDLKAINMESKSQVIKDQEHNNWNFFLNIPEIDRSKLKLNLVNDIQFLMPLFEFSGACAGCGETPYLKLLSQLFGDRSIIANATGCSSIYGGNLPTTSWTSNNENLGPAWSNSLFEDNAEFGLGMRLALDKQIEYANELLDRLSNSLGNEFVYKLKNADQTTESGIYEQRKRIKELKQKLEKLNIYEARELYSLADVLVKKDVWIVGGDGWAYDIDYGGLDHVIASNKNVNILVLDTEVYSNTGGQMSKATPMGAIAKFAESGKRQSKKDLAMMAMSYGNVYVARVAMGANDFHTVKAFLEAEAYNGPSIIIAYCHCIAHGYDLKYGMRQQKKAVDTGYWPLMRFDPTLIKQNKNPLQLDSKLLGIPLEEYVYNESRYKALLDSKPEISKKLIKCSQEHLLRRYKLYEYLANMPMDNDK